jgi:hypothetical protein
MSTYRDRHVCLATKHGKERAIARPMTRAVGAQVVVVPGLDTDVLGTFTGEVARTGTAMETCLAKARMGMAAAGLPLGIANEGSFGPHPFFPFVPAGVEFMTFVDDEQCFHITETLLADDTNYGHRLVRNIDELTEALPGFRFPSHALIVQPNSGERTMLDKGVHSIEHLAAAVKAAAEASEDGNALVQTDMRAHVNPTRMSSIRTLAFRLARRLSIACPSCATPGFGRTGTIGGLECEECGAATEMVRSEVFSCASCPHEEHRPRSDGRLLAPPARCPECNP